MARQKSDTEQLRLELDEDENPWLKLQNLSTRERELARELDDVREQLHAHAREMKHARIASVAQIAGKLDRNRQRVNSWMRNEHSSRAPDGDDHDEGWIDPEEHVPL
jgi:hypothetical protein